MGETLKGCEKVKLSRKLALTLRIVAVLALGAALVPVLSTLAQAQTDPPIATINSPASGGTYYVGEVVPTSFSCADGADDPGDPITCSDSNGSTSGSGHLDTAAPGPHTYTVTATDAVGTGIPASITYTVAGVPIATINSPASGGTYYVGEVVPTSFSCADGADDPGDPITCSDSNGSTSGSGHLDTAAPGPHTYTVTATDAVGTGIPASITYTVAGVPIATINSPASGGTYYVGEVVPTSFSCADGADDPGDPITCSDSNGSTSGSGHLDTAAPGPHTYTVTATDAVGTGIPASITYTVAGVPIATINSPASGGTYYVGEVVPTSFSCTEGTDGPGLASCDDNNGTNTASGGSGTLDTSSPGHLTCTVTATSNDTGTGTASITYTVVTPPSPPPTTIIQTAPFSNSMTLIKSRVVH